MIIALRSLSSLPDDPYVRSASRGPWRADDSSLSAGLFGARGRPPVRALYFGGRRGLSAGISMSRRSAPAAVTAERYTNV
jgi:hypothetical protein